MSHQSWTSVASDRGELLKDLPPIDHKNEIIVHKNKPNQNKTQKQNTVYLGWRILLLGFQGTVPACIASFHQLPLFQAHPYPRWPKECTPRLIFKVISKETNASGHTHKKQSGRTIWLSHPPSQGSGPKPALKMLTTPTSSLLGSALSARQVALWAGCFSRASRSRNPCRREAACVWAARAEALLARRRVGWDLRLGARHGPAGRDARVPGGAETAAERAADPGVRPGAGVWAPGHRA